MLLISSAAIPSRYTRGKGALNETSGLSGTHDSQNFDRKNQTEEFCKGFIENFKVENKPLLMIGYGCIHSDTKEILEKLINTWQIPFVSTMDAKGYISEDNLLSLGIVDTSGDIGANDYFQESKMIIAIRNSFAENVTFTF